MNVRFQSGHPTVVIGEHSMACASDLAHAFTTAGFQVASVCGDGLSLVAAARQHNPDILCLDLILPRLSGLQVLEALGGSLRSRIVAATAVSSRGRVAEAKRLGVSVYLLKPFRHDKLVTTFGGLHPKTSVRSAS